MKKIFLIALTMFAGLVATCQPWMPQDSKDSIKLQDVINQFKKNKTILAPTQKAADDEDAPGEGMEYLFERWAWYWQQHLDSNGYMVGPLKTYQEWSQYLATHKDTKSYQKTTSTTSDWQFQGPNHSHGGYSGIGRINCVSFHPTDPNTFYIGSAGGGAWKTTDNGNSWATLYSDMPTLGVSDIKVNPLNPNTIYICTGDKDGRDNNSIGVIKSTDGGLTWANTGLNWSIYSYYFARSLLINPIDTNSLTLATNLGVYKTFNGGLTWALVTAGNFEQLLYSNTDTNIIYATNYAGSAQILRSDNGGMTWVTVTSFTDAYRINLATSPASDTTVMAIASNFSYGLEGIYCSLDGGLSYNATFTNNTACTNNLLSWDLGLPSTACNGQGWYDLCIALSPTDPNKVLIGGVNHYYSLDGGKTWELATQWYTSLPGVQTVHADKHFLGYNPINGTLFATCDGGVYNTLDPFFGLWNDLTNGLGITEFYKIAIDNAVPFCIGGAQDNGTKMVNAGVYTDIRGGDGMQCQIDYQDPTHIWYASYYNGSIDRTMNGGSSWTNISNAIPDTVKGDWVTPYIIHPLNDNVLFVGYDRLFLSTDYGTSWTSISPIFSNTAKINSIAVPITNPLYIYLVLDDNSIRFSPDYGATWSLLPSYGTAATISNITADPKNENIIWITFSGYNPSAKVFMYNKTTNHWTHVNGSLPNIPIKCLVIDSTTGTKYIGTETTVMYMDTTMTDWAVYNINLPNVIVSDLKINYTTNEVWAGTYGRGIWKSVKADQVSGIATINTNRDNGIIVAPNPNKGIFTLKTTKKELFGAIVNVKILATNGKTVWQKGTKFDENGSLIINAAEIAKGTYICELNANHINFTNSIIIE